MQIVELEMVPLSLRPVLQRLYDMKTTQSALREGVLFSTKRNNYYYDTGTGKVIVLDDDTSYIFRVLFDPTLSAETFLISLTKVDPNAVKNLLQTIDAERLFQRPPLLSMGKEIAAGVTDTEQKVEQIILEVTEQCNFRCKYCVYSEDFSGNRDFGNRRMPTEIAFKAIDWALENSGAKLAITFYGGEPLLNFKLMKAVIERSQAKRGNKEIVYSFTSNMSLMTREIATYLAQVPNLYIMASIDGPRTVHDAYRVYANDAPTFEDSIGGLRILADAYAGSHMPVNINAVLTPPFGFEKLEQVNAYFESLDWLPATCHVNITYPSYGTCPGLDEYYDKITGNPKYALHGMCNPLMIWQQRKAETDGLDAYKARNIYYHSIFDDLVKINNRIIVDEPTLRRGLNGCCVPGKKRLYVTATGEYKACERIGSSPSIGNVDEGVDRELIVKKYVEEFAAQSKDICDKCWAYNLCRVCYAGVCNENGLDMGLKNEACRASRSVALNNLALYHELMEENTPYSRMAENRIRQESNLQKSKRASVEKKIKTAQHALERFEGEILKCLDGTSNFTEDMIAKQIRRYQQELDDAKAEYAALQNARLNEAAEIRKLRTYYDEFRGWAEEFDAAPLEIKRMILSQLIERVEVGRKYQVTIKLNMEYQQFLEITEEQKLIPLISA